MYFPTHVHSAFSVMDGMNDVKEIAARVAELGQPAFALTDHGTMAGVVQGYREAKKHDLAFFPGCEWYVVRDATDHDARNSRWHIGMVALDFIGYQAMIRLQTRSWSKGRFYRKPLIDLSDLASLHQDGMSDHVAVFTGCYSGMVTNEWSAADPIAHADAMIAMLQRWFPNTLFLELQDHGITWTEHEGQTGKVTDQTIARELFKLGQKHGLPTVIGGDSHYTTADLQPAHDLMKDICYFGDGEDNHFSGGPYHLMTDVEAMRPFGRKMQDAAHRGHEHLLSLNTLTIPALDNYRFHVPQMVKNVPDTVLRTKARKALVDMGLNTPKYRERLSYELEVIKKLGMANYFLMVKAHVIDWCQRNNVLVNARGSANGSLVCFVLGITKVDPIKWSTSFDRFISMDRQKPPDVDFDVDFRGRELLVDHLKQVYPTLVNIGTYSKIGFAVNDEGDDSGAVVRQYMAAMRRKDPHGFNGRIRPEHRKTLMALSDTTVFKSLGRHAAGYILPGSEQSIEEYLPIGRVISSDVEVTQFGMKDVETLGYMKLDILGLRQLQTLNGCLELIGKPRNDWKWVPLNDRRAMTLIRSGNGIGLFQFEGGTNSRGAREMQVRTTLDVILCLALYRPAMLSGGQKDMFLFNRGKTRDEQERIHPLFDPLLKDTQGVPLFQEQIMEILKTLGMEYQDWNDLMVAVKASNGNIDGARETFDRLQPVLYDLCEDAGMTDEDADDTWQTVVGFTEYGFNRAHATSYGLLAYYSAYLKSNYPLEFMASLMDVWGDDQDKVRMYAKEASRMGISIVRADVNYSGVRWAIDPARHNALRKGLVSLPGVGDKAAMAIIEERANGPYASISDFVKRTPRRPVSGGSAWPKGELTGVCKVLMESGAFRSLKQE